MHPHPPFDLPTVFAQLIECNQHKVAGLDAFQITQPLHQHIGQPIVWQHQIPVVADRDGRGDHPGVIDLPPLHPIETDSNAGQRFPGTLLPLKQGIAFLDGEVEVMSLNLVGPDFLLVLVIP